MADADDLISDWVLEKWQAPGIKIHETEYGCKVRAYNVRFGIQSEGGCNTCYHEYPAVMFDVDCSCPDKIPSKKNTSGFMTNRKKFKLQGCDIAGEFQLHEILNEILS